MSLLNTVAGALALVPKEARLLAAVSGGADSTAMLASCASIRGRAFCESGGLCAVHVDHGLRPVEECAGDAEAVRSLCGKLGVACTVAAVERGRVAAWAREEGSGIEAAARHFRHEALRREAERVGADFILTAHTRDDALETALMRVLRGSGPRGLALMPLFAPSAGDEETRSSENGAHSSFIRMVRMIFRPLRDVTRREVLDYLAEQGLSYRTDSTNGDAKYLRNRIRLRLIPVLDESFPEWRKGLFETAETQGLVADFIEEEAARRVEERAETQEDGQASAIIIENLDTLPEIVREEALFAAIDRLKDGEKPVRRQVVRDFAHDARKKAVDVGGGIRVSRGPVKIARSETFHEKGFSLLIKDAGEYRIDGLHIEAAKVDGGLVVLIKKC
jgi:tRNA(Ile)-lysidine synthase